MSQVNLESALDICANFKSLTSLSATDRERAIVTLANTILQICTQPGDIKIHDITIPDTDKSGLAAIEHALDHLRQLSKKGTDKWTVQRKELDKYVRVKDSFDWEKLPPNAWILVYQKGDYFVVSKLADHVSTEKVSSAALLSKGFDALNVKRENFAGATSTWKRVAPIAIPIFLALAGGIAYASMGQGAAAPQGPGLQPVPKQPLQAPPQPHVWHDWTYAQTEELPINCTQVCDLSQKMWRGLAETPVAIPEWVVNSLSQASSYTALPPDTQLSNAAECLERVSRFDQHTPTRTLRRGLNEVAMRGEAFAPIAYCVRGGDTVLARLDQEQTRLRKLEIERYRTAAQVPEKTEKPKPAQQPEARRPKAQQSSKPPEKTPKAKAQPSAEAPPETQKPAEAPKPAEKPVSAAEMVQTYTSKSRALARAKNEAMRLPGKDSQEFLKKIEGDIRALDKWKTDQLDAIKRDWTTRTKAMQKKYQELKGKGKDLTVEDVDPVIKELAELGKDIEATAPHLSSEVLSPHRDRVNDIRQNFVKLSSSLYRLKSIDQMARTASRLSTAPKVTAEPNPYLTQQEASEQSVPKQTPIDTLFHDSVALQSQLDSSIRQTEKLLERTEPLTIDIVTKHHMQVAAKLSTLETRVQAHYKGIHDQKSSDLSQADPPENQAGFDRAIALTRMGLAKSIIQQLTSDKIARTNRLRLIESASKLLEQAETDVQENVRKKDRESLLASIKELRGQIPAPSPLELESGWANVLEGFMSLFRRPPKT